MDDNAAILRSTYVMLSSSSDYKKGQPEGQLKAKPDRRDTIATAMFTEDQYVQLSLTAAAASLLVAIQACLSKEDWVALLPHLWLLAEPKAHAPNVIRPVSDEAFSTSSFS